MDELIYEASVRKAGKIHLSVDEKNENARRLYEKKGFTLSRINDNKVCFYIKKLDNEISN